jgi:hypothetical protein
MDLDPAPRLAPSLAPEHDWEAARSLIHPALKPVGTSGVDGQNIRLGSGHSPGLPLVRQGPENLAITYVIPGAGFDVLVGIDHLLSWGMGPEEVHAAAMANLGAWSAKASWAEEVDGRRRIMWSDWGTGMDAARILLDEVRAKLTAELGPRGRILVGLPERDLLIATGLSEGDDEFPALFADYVADRAQAADEPIDDRVLELVDGKLAEFRVLSPA